MKIFIKGISKENAKRVTNNAMDDLIKYVASGNTKVTIQSNEMLVLEMPNENKYELRNTDIGQTILIINNPYVLNDVMLIFGENMIQGIEIRME